ncbi:MAG TPA: hypothetical protein VF540_05020 [Segetibacter sp.]|jgi:hypothetical protein
MKNMKTKDREISIKENADFTLPAHFSKASKIEQFNAFTISPYVRELQNLKLVDTIIACLLMARLELLFEANPNGFHKYTKPCNFQILEGSKCWVDLLCISPHQFRTAFDQIGVRYKTKEDFDKEKDKFKGKYYCSFSAMGDLNRTYYFRNNKLVDDCFEQLLSKSAGEDGDFYLLKDNPSDFNRGIF